MERALIRLIRGLRQDGLSVSTGEELDAFRALIFTDITDRELLRLSLRGVLVKEHAFYPLFEDRFNMSFPPRIKRPRQAPVGKGQSAGEGPGARRQGEPDPGAPRRGMQRVSPNLPEDLPHRIGNENASPEEPGREREKGDRGDPLRPKKGKSRKPADLPAEEPPEGSAFAREEAQLSLGWRARPDEELRWGPAREKEPPGGAGKRENLKRMRFSALLTAEDERQIDQEIDRLARTLRSRKSRRERQAQSGRIDLKRVLRENLQTDAVPFLLPRKRRRLERAELVVLCDVSWSVRKVSRFLLRMLYAIQQKFSHIRSFAFVDRPVEITALADGPDLLACLAQIPELDSHIRSDYGNTFYRFIEDFGHTLSRRTVLLILGDARNNRLDPLSWALEEISGRAREAIWLNPEERERWDRDDSVIGIYGRYCRAVLECGNLEQLAQAVRVIAHAPSS